MRLEIHKYEDMSYVKTVDVLNDTSKASGDYLYNRRFEIAVSSVVGIKPKMIVVLVDDFNNQQFTGTVSSVSDTSVIVESFLRTLDMLLFKGTYTGVIEDLFLNSLNSYFKTNTDTLQNLPYVTFSKSTSTSGSLQVFDENTTFLDGLSLAFKKYFIVADVTADITNRTIVINFVKRGANLVELKTDIADIQIDYKFEDVDALNKIEYRKQDATGVIAGVYYLKSDGTTTTNASDPLTLVPRVFDRKVVDPSANLAELSQQDLKANVYNHEVLITITNSSKIVDVKSLRIGHLMNIYDDNFTIRSVITSITIDVEKDLTNIKLGVMRGSLLAKLQTGGI